MLQIDEDEDEDENENEDENTYFFLFLFYLKHNFAMHCLSKWPPFPACYSFNE